MGCSTHTLAGLAQSTCETNLAGIKKAYIANYENVIVSAITFEGGSVESAYTISEIVMAAGKKFYAYNFAKQTGSLTSTLTKDETNGTRYYTNEAALQFNKMEAKKHLEMAALCADPTAVIILDNNGKYWFLGYDSYVSASEGTTQTGQSFDDLNGYNLTLQSQSAYLPIEVKASAISGIVEEVEA